MGKWLALVGALLGDELSETPSWATDKTDKTRVPSVLAVPDEGVCENKRLLTGQANDSAPPSAVLVNDAARTCADCANILPRGTCGEPEAAGLSPNFGIRWASDGHAAGCEAFARKMPEPAQDRPYRLSLADADRCHAPCWNDAEIARFVARVGLFLRCRVNATDADDLAERMVLRDRDRDERRACLECAHYRPGHCGNHRAAMLNSSEIGTDFAARPQQCSGFES